jgi:hypothetical protein
MNRSEVIARRARRALGPTSTTRCAQRKAGEMQVQGAQPPDQESGGGCKRAGQTVRVIAMSPGQEAS